MRLFVALELPAAAREALAAYAVAAAAGDRPAPGRAGRAPSPAPDGGSPDADRPAPGPADRAPGPALPGPWRPVAPAALHVTLAFLGARPPTDVPAIEAVLRAAAGTPAPDLALGAPLLLPPRRPRVLAVAIDDADGILAALQARVGAALVEAGVHTPERRPFRAHATVARLRPRRDVSRSLPPPPAPLAFRATRLTLYESRLHPQGARYEPHAQVDLGT